MLRQETALVLAWSRSSYRANLTPLWFAVCACTPMRWPSRLTVFAHVFVLPLQAMGDG